METIHTLPYTNAAVTRCGRNHAQNMSVSAISRSRIEEYATRPDCRICPECEPDLEHNRTAFLADRTAERVWQCHAEDCNEPAVAGGEGLCDRHADDLRRSRAFWTPGKLTLAPMPENHPTHGQTQQPA